MSGTTHRCACQSSYHVAACPGVSPACGGFSCGGPPDYCELLAPSPEFEPAETDSSVSGTLPA